MEDIRNEERFLHLIKKHTRVLVDVYTTYCNPCKKLIPKLEEMSKSRPNIYFCKVNGVNLPFITEESPPLKSSISSVPTLIYFVEGEERGRYSGTKIEDIERLIL